MSDCDAISGAVELAAAAPLHCILPSAPQLLWQVTSCRVQENAVPPQGPAELAVMPLLMRCGELSVGGVCRCRGLGCNYSQWLSADYISANVLPSASILMKLGSVAECIGALQGRRSDGVRGASSPHRLGLHSGPRTGFAITPPSGLTSTL